MLYKLVYKQKSLLRDGLVDASSLEIAEELGREWCAEHNARFVSVTDPVLISEKKTPPGVVSKK